MMKKFKSIVSVVMVIALIFCVAEIFALQNEIENLQNNSSYQYERINDSINSIYDNVDEMLEKETQLIYGVSWDYGEIKKESNTVELTVNATAKKYTEGKTTFEVFCNGKGHPMSNTKGNLKSVFEIPMFSEVNLEKIVFTTDGTVETQELSLGNITPKEPLLASVSAELSSWQHSSEPKEDESILKFNGILGVNITDSRSSADISKAYLVSFISAKETARIPLENFERIKDDKNIEMSDGYEHYRLDNLNFSVPKGKNMQVYFEVEDSLGYIHRIYILRVKANENGYIECDNPHFDKTEIYSADGKYLGYIYG